MPDETPVPFGLMLRRAGDVADPDADWPDPHEYEGIYLAPDFTVRHLRHGTGAVSDPRYGEDAAQQWSLSLPHQCGEWGIWDGTREEVLDAARRFRDELDQAIAALEDAEEPGSHVAEWTLPFPPLDLTDMKTWPAPLPLAAQIARPESRAHGYIVGGFPRDPTPGQLELIRSGEWRLPRPDGTWKSINEILTENADG